MTTNVIDAAAAGADSRELAIENKIVVDAGKFQTILIPACAGVVNGEIAKEDVTSGI